MNGFPVGMRVIISEHATTQKTNWPVAKRSRRLHKKLVKKRGPQFTREPAMWSGPLGIIVHPIIYAEMERRAALLSDGSASRADRRLH